MRNTRVRCTLVSLEYIFNGKYTRASQVDGIGLIRRGRELWSVSFICEQMIESFPVSRGEQLLSLLNVGAAHRRAGSSALLKKLCKGFLSAGP